MMEDQNHHQRLIPLIIPRSEHPISRKMMSEEALKVLYRLHQHGFTAYLVGGSVRDLLLSKVPKDFDVATNAHPHEINVLFKNSRIIGRRFRLVQVYFKGGKIIEVSTFRSHSEFEETETEDGNIIRTDNFGTPEEDALRRDITINGLFYNIADFSIIDYVGGMTDLKRRIIRTIGNPNERFQQDPVRMIRVIRHAVRTGFPIEDPTYQAIIRHRKEIQKCSPSRVRDEFLRDLREGLAQPSLNLMLQTGLLSSLFPDLDRVLGDRNPWKTRDQQFFLTLFSLTDKLANMGRAVPESVLFALFLIPFLQAAIPEHPFLAEKERSIYLRQSIQLAVRQILNPYSFPKGIKEIASQILTTQSSLKKAVQRGIIPKKLKTKTYFKEAVLLYGIQAQAKGENVPPFLRNRVPSDLLPWWPKGWNRRRRSGKKSLLPTSALIYGEGKDRSPETETTE